MLLFASPPPKISPAVPGQDSPPTTEPASEEAPDEGPLSPRLLGLRRAIEEGQFRVDAILIAQKLVGQAPK